MPATGLALEVTAGVADAKALAVAAVEYAAQGCAYFKVIVVGSSRVAV